MQDSIRFCALKTIALSQHTPQWKRSETDKFIFINARKIYCRKFFWVSSPVVHHDISGFASSSAIQMSWEILFLYLLIHF